MFRHFTWMSRLNFPSWLMRRSTPEVVSLTLDFYRRNYIEGLFLSSGIIQSPDYTMEQAVLISAFSPQTLITIHPSALLRASDEQTRARDYQQFLDDLRKVSQRLSPP
jgi:DNA-binding transcriptional regulator WhiA